MTHALPVAAFLALALGGAAMAAPIASAVDKSFVAKVSQGGHFEVEASKLAESKATAQDVKDFAAAEVHDHTLVGDKLKSISKTQGVAIVEPLNAEFSGKLAALKALDGGSFDRAYMSEMADIHAKDGAAFAKEAKAGGAADYRAFAAETHLIVLRHIGAIHAAPPTH
jgi:putative membrane protein